VIRIVGLAEFGVIGLTWQLYHLAPDMVKGSNMIDLLYNMIQDPDPTVSQGCHPRHATDGRGEDGDEEEEEGGGDEEEEEEEEEEEGDEEEEEEEDEEEDDDGGDDDDDDDDNNG
jgi:hypothetical protein